jgi:PAS domain S-box-containing protein
MLVTILIFLFLILTFLQVSIKKEFIDKQISDSNKIEFIINSFLNGCREDFIRFHDGGNQKEVALFLNSFSDIYYINSDFKIISILKKEERSHIFSHYNFRTSNVGAFFNSLKKEGFHSSTMLYSPEKDTISIYMTVKEKDRILVGRIGLDKLRNTLSHIAGYMNSIIITATHDGFILSSTSEFLPFNILPKTSTEVTLDKRYLYTRKSNQILNNDIVLLTPLDAAYKIIDTVKNYYFGFLAAVILIILLKSISQLHFIMKPMEQLVTVIKEWKLEKSPDIFSGGFFKIEEILSLYNAFFKKSSEIETAVEALRQKEYEMNKMRLYLKNIIESMPSMLISINDAGIIHEWNEAATTFTGVNASQAIGYGIWDVVPSFKIFQNDISDVSLTGRLREIKKAYIKNGSEKYVNISIFPISGNGEKGMAIRLDDITEIEKVEEQLRQSQKMEMIGTLAGGFAHDFNNMLGGIIGTISLCKLKLSKPLEPDKIKAMVAGYIDTVEKLSVKAADLVSHLLILARKKDVNYTLVDINTIIDQIIAICKNSFDKSIEFRYNSQIERAIVKADPAQVEQIILNLFVNAAHAMTIMRKENEIQGGVLDISVRKIVSDEYFLRSHSDALDNTDYIIITVSDSGVGMDSKTVAKIFDPFFTTKEKGKGTGLGLSMVYNIIRQHQGFIDVYSEEGSGTSFHVYFPASSDIAILREEQSQKVLRAGTGVILVVDDEETMRELAKDILQECGYTVLMAGDGEEGIEVFRKNYGRINLILLDMVMPKKSGIEAFREILEIRPDIKVLLTSGFNADSRVQKAVAMGVNGFIQKPYTIDNLSESVYSILNS